MVAGLKKRGWGVALVKPYFKKYSVKFFQRDVTRTRKFAISRQKNIEITFRYLHNFTS